MSFLPHFWTSVVGSFPHLDGAALSRKLVDKLDVPDWPQLPNRTFRENMYAQYSASLPAIVFDDAHKKIYFDTTGDITPAMEYFYEHYLSDDVEAFSLRPEWAAGFFAMLDALRQSPGEWIKGQVTGPVSLGLTVTDQDLRAGLYNELLADAIVKNLSMNARWQVRQLKAVRPNVFIFVDEPYLASFGSAYISLSRELVIGMLDEVFEAIHSEGALAGVHCCANTDWSVLLATQVDILNLDAYGYMDNLALYPLELRRFLDRNGVVAWGIVPNNATVAGVTPRDLSRRLQSGLQVIVDKAATRGVQIKMGEFASRSLIVPSCGLGSTTVEIAEQVVEMVVRTGEILQQEL